MEKASSSSRCVVSLLIFILWFISRVSAIRMDPVIHETHICRNTVQGRYLLSDDNGHVCDAFSLDLQSRCCPEIGERFSCYGCNLYSRCCKAYEYCVSCCLDPSRTHIDQVVKVKISKPSSAGNYDSVFDFCSGRCRHNSESVFLVDLLVKIHENAYISEFHHCFSIPSNSSGVADKHAETRLAGINVIVGRQGESCDIACKSIGQSCVPNKLMLLNQCEIMQKYLSCKGACLASMGSDQPAEVVDDAPRHLNPGACLYTQTQSLLSCDGSHPHTRRLCPCA